MAQLAQEKLHFFSTISLENLWSEDLAWIDIGNFELKKLSIVCGYNNLSQNKLLISENSQILEELKTK